MGQMTKKQIIEKLTSVEVTADLANQYASAFLEYQEATENIERNGSVVTHPRTGNIIPNPYLKIRDAADGRLIKLRPIIGPSVTDWFWKVWDFETK